MTERTKIARAAAKALGLRRYYTGQPCKYGHVGERRVATHACITCETGRVIAWQAANPERNAAGIAFRGARWIAANRDRKRATFAAWRERNAEKVKADSEAWRAANQAKIITDRKARYAADPKAFYAASLLRKARIRRQTPPWVDRKALAAIYRATPPGHHVDHIVPLKGRRVSGLHVPWNLQYLPGPENLSKSNRHEEP